MKEKFKYILFGILLTGCSSGTKDPVSIEFMSYNWSRYDDKTESEVPAFVK